MNRFLDLYKRKKIAWSAVRPGNFTLLIAQTSFIGKDLKELNLSNIIVNVNRIVMKQLS